MALVLIVGAAVVLWYGNTLNSWVLGGLIGGFGAVLLSIPISLVLFSYFSQHYPHHQQEEVPEDTHRIARAQRSPSILVQDQSDDDDEYLEYQDSKFEYNERDDDRDEYLLAEQNGWEEESPHRIAPARYLSAPSSVRSSTVNADILSQRSWLSEDAELERQSLGKKASVSHPVKSTGSPSYQAGPSYSQYRSEALRAARAEAVLRSNDQETSIFITNSSKRQKQMQSSKSRRSQPAHDGGSFSANDKPQRLQRTVDSLPRRSC